MQKLYQKNHGLPSIGKLGENGSKGQNGNSVYFGFVNDFFDGINFNASSWVLYGARKNCSTNVENPNASIYYTAYFNRDVNDAYIDSSYVYQSGTGVFGFLYSYPNWNDSSKGYDLSKHESTQLYYSNTSIWANYIAVDTSQHKSDLNILSFAAVENGYDTIYNSSVIAINGSVYKSKLVDGSYSLVTKSLENSKDFVIDYIKNTSIYDSAQNDNMWKDANGNSYYVTNDELDASIKQLYSISIDAAKNRMKALNLESDVEQDNINQAQIIKGRLKMDKNDNIELKYPTTLNSKYKAGDVLYFWTDEQQFEYDKKITNMVVVTDDLVGIDFDTFLKNSTLENPFRFNFTNIDSTIHSSIENDICVYRFENDLGQSDEAEVYKSNFYNLIDKDGYKLTLGEFNDNASSNITQFINLYQNSVNSLLFNVDFDVDNKVFNVTANDKAKELRFNQLYVNSDCLTTNFELVNTIENNDLIFDSGGYIQAFTEDDFDYYNKTFIVNPAKYFTNFENKKDYTIGCLIRNAAVIQHRILYDLQASENSIILPDDIKTDGTSYILWTYICNLNSGIKNYSQPITFTIDSSSNSFTIKTLTSKNNKEVIVNENDVTNYVDFICESLSPNEITNGSFTISYNSSTVQNVSLYFDSKQLTNDKVNGSWYSISKENESNDTNGNKTLSFDINCSNNLPNIKDDKSGLISNSKTIDEYLQTYSDEEKEKGKFYRLLENNKIYSTTDRSIGLTIRYTVNGTIRQSYYEITQQGFTDPRQFLDLDIHIEDNPVNLEKLNSHDNGILANQFQFYTTVKLKNTELTNYVDNVKITLDVESLNYDYSALRNNNSNSKLFSTVEFLINDNSNNSSISNDIKNNYIAISNYLDDIEIDELNSSLAFKNSQSSPIANSSLYYYIGTPQRDGMFTKPYNEFCKNMSTANKGYLKELTSDVVIDNQIVDVVNQHGCLLYYTKVPLTFEISNISGDTIEKHFRTLVEFGNPIPAHFNFMWCIKGYTISYDINEKTFTFTNDGINLYTEKTMPYSHVKYYDWKFTSNKFSFWINPLSLTLASSKYEDSYDIIPSIYMKGSDEEINLVTELYRQDDVNKIINENLAINSSYYSKENCVTNNRLCLPNYILTKNLFQDDIKSINIYPYDFNENLNNISNIFKKTLDFFGVEDNTYTQNVLNWGDNNFYESPFFDTNYSIYDENSFIALAYNYNLMLAKQRNDVLTFFYNGEEFEANRYAQYNNNAPLFVNGEINYEFRSNDTLEAIENYNKIYQSLSSSLKSITTYNGVLSTYADGYNYLNSFIYNEDTDYLDLQENMNKAVFNDTEYYGITISKTSKNSEYYPYYQPRTLLYNIAWLYPKYNDDNTITPFKFVDNMQYYAIYYYLLKVFDTNSNDYSYGEENPHLNELPYEKLFAADKNALSMFNENKELINDLTNGFRFIPYTACYDVYPRIAYNSKASEFNVLMLRKPSVVKENQYEFTTDDLKISLASGQSIQHCTTPFSILK